MASTDYTDLVTVVTAAWLDDVDKVAYAGLTSVGGTADAITATGPVGMAAYAARDRFFFIPTGTNTGATTINITGTAALGARNIFCGGAACVGGEIRTGIPVFMIDDGTRFHIVGPYSGGAVPGNIAGAGSIKSSHATAGIGYATGAGGTQTQGTSKSTTVVLNKATGEITMHNATLNAATSVAFTLTNSAVATGDYIAIQHISAGTLGAYNVSAIAGSGSATVTVYNNTGGNLGEAIVLKFVVIKAVTA